MFVTLNIQYNLAYLALDELETSINWEFTELHYISPFHLLVSPIRDSKASKRK
jgi:hypothetical protein